MLAQTLKEVFDPFVELDIQVWKNFENLGELKTFKKGQIIKAAHTTEKYISLIIAGSGGGLIWNKNNFVCIDIACKNDFLTDYMSFTLQQPTPIEVRLFEKTTLFRISYFNFQQTLLKGNYGEKITRIISDSSFIDKQQQQIDLLTKSAKERYLELLNTKIEAQNMPLKYLASYLGITPQSLSRIRSEKV